MKWVASFVLVLAAVAFSAAPGAGQLAPVEPATDLVDDAVEDVSGTVEDVSGTVEDVSGTVEDVVESVSDSAGGNQTTSDPQQGTAGAKNTAANVGSVVSSADPSPSAPAAAPANNGAGGAAASRRSARRGGGAVSPGKSFRSAFDRLPNRFERLLERIELGRNVRANLRRLERALASASPSQRERLLRLVEAEIRRLRAGGVSPAERKRLARLNRVARVIAGAAPTATPTPTVADPSPSTPVEGDGPATIAPAAGGVLPTAVGESRPPQPGGGAEPYKIPDGGTFPFVLGFIVVCILGLGILGVAFAFNEKRAARG